VLKAVKKKKAPSSYNCAQKKEESAGPGNRIAAGLRSRASGAGAGGPHFCLPLERSGICGHPPARPRGMCGMSYISAKSAIAPAPHNGLAAHKWSYHVRPLVWLLAGILAAPGFGTDRSWLTAIGFHLNFISPPVCPPRLPLSP
jgi:hypothetical protein